MIETPQLSDYVTILPVLFLTVWACIVLLLDLLVPRQRKWITALVAVAGLALTLGFSWVFQKGVQSSGFSGMVVLDGFALFLNALLLASGVLGIAVAYGYNRRMNLERGEYYSLLLFSIIGMMLMVQAGDLIVVFIALELLSIPLYVLAAFNRMQAESEEAGIKYFLLGAFSTGFVVYGIALVFGATGTTGIYQIIRNAANASPVMLSVGAALILVGFGFKVAAVPFHMWTPDVYQGAPTSVTAFMAAGAKVAGFAALLRVFAAAFLGIAADMTPILWGLAALTMVVGNVIAISQTNIKRLLAYSSIAHAGYILMAFVPYGNAAVMPKSVAAGLFYLVSYALTSFGAWAVVIALEKAEGKGLEISDYAGLGRKYPAMAAAMMIFMLSFIGLPPTLGLIGKFYLFRAVIDGGFVGLAILGVVTSLVSAYYYLRVVMTMYMQEGDPQTTSEFFLNFTWLFSALGVVVLSLVPQVLFALASSALLGGF